MKVLTLEDINSLGAGDWVDVDTLVHSLQHHGYLAWYENVKLFNHATHSQVWIDDEELAYIVNAEMTGSMIEEWKGVDEDQSVPNELRMGVDCDYCGAKIQNSPRYNGYTKPKSDKVDSTLERVRKALNKAFDEDIMSWDLQTLTDEVKEEIRDCVFHFMEEEFDD